MRVERPIVLLGPMGTGKSTVGNKLAALLGCEYLDNDAEISARYGISSERLSEMPVDQLHQLESRYLREVLLQQPPFVAGVAGSVVETVENRNLLKAAFCVYLYIPLDVVQQRAGSSGVGRQALRSAGANVLAERFVRRDPLYRDVASFELRDRESPESDAQRILQALNLFVNTEDGRI